MSNAKYNPPSPKTLGVQTYINTYWTPRPENERHYDFDDFKWFVRQKLNAFDIARAFGFKSAAPAKNAMEAFKAEQSVV
jgi:hypothetical protein